jgi:hypothetical protein
MVKVEAVALNPGQDQVGDYAIAFQSPTLICPPSPQLWGRKKKSPHTWGFSTEIAPQPPTLGETE